MRLIENLKEQVCFLFTWEKFYACESKISLTYVALYGLQNSYLIDVLRSYGKRLLL